MNLHKHIWRYQEEDSNERLDIFLCNWGAFARVTKDPYRDKPILVEGGDGKGQRIKVSWTELKICKSILFRGGTWIIDFL